LRGPPLPTPIRIVENQTSRNGDCLREILLQAAQLPPPPLFTIVNPIIRHAIPPTGFPVLRGEDPRARYLRSCGLERRAARNLWAGICLEASCTCCRLPSDSHPFFQNSSCPFGEGTLPVKLHQLVASPPSRRHCYWGHRRQSERNGGHLAAASVAVGDGNGKEVRDRPATPLLTIHPTRGPIFPEWPPVGPCR
jgi:hypothetical protein